jgi:hypothetical protein
MANELTHSSPSGAPAAEQSLVNLIARAATDPATDVAKLQALLDMQERILKREAVGAYNQAMAAVAAELEPIGKDARNTHIGNRYARLETIDAALRPIYSRHGFSVRYGSEPAADGSVRVTCTVAHREGHSETLALTAPVDALGTGGRASKTGVQAIGSSVTYLRRYLLCMAWNVMTFDDDDGEASRRHAAPPPPPRLDDAFGPGLKMGAAKPSQKAVQPPQAADGAGIPPAEYDRLWRLLDTALNACGNEAHIDDVARSPEARRIKRDGRADQLAQVADRFTTARAALKRAHQEAEFIATGTTIEVEGPLLEGLDDGGRLLSG